MEKEILTTLNQAKYWFATRDCSKLAFDTELTNIKWDDMQIVGISFCNGESACYIDLYENPEYLNIVRFLQRKFKFDIKKLIAHNIPFDLKVIYQQLFVFLVTDQIFCTQTAAHLINENEPKGLKYLAHKYLNIPLKDIKKWDEVNSDYHSEEFYKYALNDVIWTWQLHEIFDKELVWQGLDKLFFDIEMPFQFVLRDLAIDGVLVDQNKIADFNKELQQIIFDLQLKMVKSAGLKYGIQCNLFDGSKEILTKNFNSSNQLVDIITKNIGLDITEETPTGKLSVGKLSMLKLKGKHEFIDLLDKYKKAKKLLNGFIEPLPDYICKDGRVRTSFNNTVAVTGRLSSSKPNLQQLPKSNKPIDFRSCFIAPKGKQLIVADYIGQELRVLAEVSKDENLIKAFENNYDLHLRTANNIFQLNIPDSYLVDSYIGYKELRKKFDEQRDIGKNGVNYPIVYGKTDRGLALDFNISVEKAQKWLAGFHNLYPDVKKAMNQTKGEVIYQKGVRHGLGRKRRFIDISNKAFRQAFNFMIQGFCADLFRLAAIKVRELSLKNLDWGLKLVLLVHDEIVMECNERYVKRAIPKIKEAMEGAVKICVDLPVDIGVGGNYSEAK